MIKKLSLIIPVYNVEQYLQRCLDSIRPLLTKEIEIIIIIDGSVDRSKEIADTFAKESPDIIKVIVQKNAGLSAARNAGLNVAHGEYIWFIDSDDYIDVNEFFKIRSNINSQKYDAIVFGRVDEYPSLSIKNTFLNDKEYSSGIDFFIDSLHKDVFRTNAWDKIFRRSILEKNRLRFIEGRLYEDMLFCLEFYLIAGRIKQCNVYPYHYILYNSNSITKQVRIKDLDVLWYIHKASEMVKDICNTNSKFECAFNQLIFNWVNSCLLKKYIPLSFKNKEAKEICNEVFHDPIFKRTIIYNISHRVLLRQYVMAWILFLSPRLYSYLINKLLIIKSE